MSADNATQNGTKPWHDPERLEELYHEEGLTSEEVGERLGCSGPTVRKHMEEHGIERRDSGGGWNKGPRLRFDIDAGMVYRDDGDYVSIHRLLAVAEYGFEEVCDSGVYHRNGVEWDNRPSNILIDQMYVREEMIEWLDLFVSEFGFVPASTDLQGWPGPSPATYSNEFGSFPAAVREAGYTPRGEADD